ncbi:MAG: Nif3-like dinuclear metal center hexameric protein [Gemmatimonadota bacterium]|jgi:dinuclear metal center YbgI/SA1388 family protein
MITLSALVEYADGLLDIPAHPDYRTALNGLQVDVAVPPAEAGVPVRKLGAAVDTSRPVIDSAVREEVDLLLVHHGLFWDGLRPLTGRRFLRVEPLIRNRMGLYSAHLPLDAHPELGNCILLARALELNVKGRFGEYEGRPIGFWGTPREWDLAALVRRLEEAVRGPVRLLEGAGDQLAKVAVVTGGGGSFIEEAARQGMDALVTGEGSHHTFVDAREMGVNVLYGGHYATETFGVKALAAHLADRFALEWTFLDHPSGL